MKLFQQAREPQIEGEAPLAHRVRPRTLDEFIGQEHIVGPGRLLRRAIQADQLSSLIFYGPPGTGKTTLAMVIANTTESHFITINAVLAGVKQIREAIAEAEERRNLYNQRTTLFVDEVHRWNKAQQDALLPHVERGTIILIGATTENPYFEVNRALVSRSRIFQLKPLTPQDLRGVAWQALRDPERGYGSLPVDLHEDALEHLVNVANGDARGVLNALELAVETTPPREDGTIVVDLAVAEESIQRRAVLYDKDGDAHYDTISAFIKSLRGSDPDAALYWLAKMVYAGEDPRFIFRRMAILAGEDVGLADPNAINVVVSCWEAFERIGMPEGAFHLTEATLYLATCAKSNSTLAFFDAMRVVEEEREAEVPTHLRDASRDKEGFGHGKGYLYPHAFRDHWVAQQYLPGALQGKLFYQPGDQGYERAIAGQVARRREAQLAAMIEAGLAQEPEVLTTGPQDRRRDAWLQRTVSNAGRNLAHVRERLFDLAEVQRHHLLLVLNAGSGLLTWEAVRRAPEGGVWALASDSQLGDMLRQQASSLPALERPAILIGALDEIDYLLSLRGEQEVRFDRVLARNPFSRTAHPWPDLTARVAALLLPEGRFCFAQIVPRRGQRLSALVDWEGTDPGLLQRLRAAEEAIFHDAEDPLVNWDVAEVEAALRAGGLEPEQVRVERHEEQRTLTAEHLARWFETETVDGARPSYAARLEAGGITGPELQEVATRFRRQLQGVSVAWESSTAYVIATPAPS
ncbi:MAG: AAA family ATPase [Anaerolineae bacterium]|nr:AAA family ATPase [Anaerolineae bacterium]